MFTRGEMPLVSHFEQTAGLLLPSGVEWKFHLSKQYEKMGFNICLDIQIHRNILVLKKQGKK
jgi:hypothetical protein